MMLAWFRSAVFWSASLRGIAIVVALLLDVAVARAEEFVRIDDVRIDVGTERRDLQSTIRGLLEVWMIRETPTYDPRTYQARWPYWIMLHNKDLSDTYAFHLTYLERRTSHGFDRVPQDDVPFSRWDEAWLDQVRSDLHVGPHASLWFPCAETLAPARAVATRSRAGWYAVRRVYRGDVSIDERDMRGVKTGSRMFIPVRVEFEISFGALEPSERRVARDLKWARLSHRCETCRPAVLCESLAHASRFPPDVSPNEFVVDAKETAHVVGGLEKRAVATEPGMADWQLTITCTRWRPLNGPLTEDRCWKETVSGHVPSDGSALQIQTDRTEIGLAASEPYLTVHHSVPAACLLRMGAEWVVEMWSVDIADSWTEFGRRIPDGPGAWDKRADLLSRRCVQDGRRVWQGKLWITGSSRN